MYSSIGLTTMHYVCINSVFNCILWFNTATSRNNCSCLKTSVSHCEEFGHNHWSFSLFFTCFSNMSAAMLQHDLLTAKRTPFIVSLELFYRFILLNN